MIGSIVSRLRQNFDLTRETIFIDRVLVDTMIHFYNRHVETSLRFNFGFYHISK